MAPITPYKIAIPDGKITRLQQKLALADFPDGFPEGDSSCDLGPSVAEIRRLAGHWHTGFDWRKVEAELNELPHFMARVDVGGVGSFDVHHIHKRSDVPGAIPLLFLHGWPGSFLEVTRMLHDLVQKSPAFHVVAPSLIDFGFSSASPHGFTLENHAETYHKLMQALGYQHYVIQAGDVGCMVGRTMAKEYGNAAGCLALHTNTPLPSQPDKDRHPKVYAKFASTPPSLSEQASLAKLAAFMTEGNGYAAIQSTRPLTLAYSMHDSPVGLLAWLYEKITAWSGSGPGRRGWTDDEMLTWVSVYWFSTAGPAAPNKTYWMLEHGPVPFMELGSGYVDVPHGIGRFADDSILLPRLWNHTLGPVVYEGEHESGGHFAAWQNPGAIVGDLKSMFGKGGPAYQHVKSIGG